MSTIRPLLASFLVAAALSGCAGGPSAEDMQKGVESAMSAKDYAGAVAKADEALKNEAISKDPAQAWRFESMRLNALADSGKGADVVGSLGRLAMTFEKQTTASLYRSLADKLRLAGDGTGANDVLVAGDKRFPGDASFKEAIEALNASADPAEVERLKALGYL
ncbi:MAG: hypothetical protein Q8P41_28390 [Pseudomonadota bacterium]|nr:hypothetical protein [Pseudomonadota bacterium]